MKTNSKMPKDYAEQFVRETPMLTRRERIALNIILVLSGACSASLFLAACYMVGGSGG